MKRSFEILLSLMLLAVYMYLDKYFNFRRLEITSIISLMMMRVVQVVYQSVVVGHQVLVNLIEIIKTLLIYILQNLMLYVVKNLKIE